VDNEKAFDRVSSLNNAVTCIEKLGNRL